MKENFSPRYILNLRAHSPTGKVVNITIFSEYRPDEVELKRKAIWALDVLRIDDENEVIDFSYGEKTFIHPRTNEKFTIVYD
ncbi:hypothetical protein OHV84_09905 [Acinetobacter baumannii]|nr:hypothetical protein [Acinetobacter baumannii]MDC4885533.1 hypothetical protein [Acinetobacter baumannii]MDC4925236.1 hypothetical protein [Acinetobacter baumannii]MDC4940147.1 hypothetical protein [Acinetobacter baumannii]